MDTINELTSYVRERAKSMWNLDSESRGGALEEFPEDVVDFVVECFKNECHFPKNRKEKLVVEDLERSKNAMAMACVQILMKAGGDGEVSHSENGISRQYDSAWISPSLMTGLPNYVSIF